MLGSECRYANLISNKGLWYSGWNSLEYALKASHGVYSGFRVRGKEWGRIRVTV